MFKARNKIAQAAKLHYDGWENHYARIADNRTLENKLRAQKAVWSRNNPEESKAQKQYAEDMIQYREEVQGYKVPESPKPAEPKLTNLELFLEIFPEMESPMSQSALQVLNNLTEVSSSVV